MVLKSCKSVMQVARLYYMEFCIMCLGVARLYSRALENCREVQSCDLDPDVPENWQIFHPGKVAASRMTVIHAWQLSKA